LSPRLIYQSMDRLVEARKDVDAAISVWGELIPERMGDRIRYATLKGSVLKRWDSIVDYVPVISDLDIHICTIKDQPIFPHDRDGFRYALETTGLYEERFKELRPGNIHIPRPQIVKMESNREIWLPERTDDTLSLFGETPFREEESEADCRKRDHEALMELDARLKRMPGRIIDRIGLEYFRILRELCYIVSPTPVRVLSQFTGSKKAWKMNRTHIILGLEGEGLTDLAISYRSYYYKGWEAFETGFKDNGIMRELIALAYDVLWRSHGIAKEI